jgi:class 3 adenylate cyclase/CheY-like chemotaxis protein
MHDPPRILVVDDNETNRDILITRLAVHGYELLQASDGPAALSAAGEHLPDLILLDVMMPGMDGMEVCRRLKADGAMPFTPVILVTARADSRDVVGGLDAGADEYLTKPVDQAALVARVRSMLKMKALHDSVQAQARELAAWNRTLETRVAEQVAEIERISRLKRFLAPQVAELIVSSGDDRLLDAHRRDVAVLFCDLRGFTAFAEIAEPEEITAVLREYHACLGRLVHEHEGTLERFTGDGLIVIFNDPILCQNPSLRAVRLALEMRKAIGGLAEQWRKLGHMLGFGIGVAYGYATLGRVGYEGRVDYTAIGSVVNLASRLCGEAQTGQVLIDSKVYSAIEAVADTESLGELVLKGFHRSVPAYAVRGLRA